MKQALQELEVYIVLCLPILVLEGRGLVFQSKNWEQGASSEKILNVFFLLQKCIGVCEGQEKPKKMFREKKQALQELEGCMVLCLPNQFLSYFEI